MSQFHDAATRAGAFLLTCALLVAGCSSSSNSPALSGDDNVLSNIDSNATTAQPVADPISSEVSDEVIVSTSDPIEETSELVTPASDDIPVETIANEQNSEPTTESVPDLLVQNRTQVDFGITVPAYQSDALQVRLTWGDIQASAAWVGDEQWSLSLDFPSNTEHLLTIVFSDGNGDIELGSYEQTYRTGFNDAESLQISADRFDTDRWDADGDGVSNLNELLVGDDPLVINSVLLDIRDSLRTDDQRLMFLIERDSESFETKIPDERPYFEDEEVVDPPPEYWEGFSWDQHHQTTINIDAAGNGTYSRFSRVQLTFGDYNTLNDEGTRIRSGGSIQWSGFKRLFNNNAGCQIVSVRFDTQTVKTDEGVITQESDHNHSVTCGDSEAPQISYSLTGVELDESQFCEATAGRIAVERIYSGATTISKAPEDSHWNVNRIDSEGQFIEEYLVPSIDLKFFCQHEDS